MGPQPEEVTPAQIRERMADTRASLASNIDLLRKQANPRALMTHGLTDARRKLHGAGNRATRKASGEASKVADEARQTSGQAVALTQQAVTEQAPGALREMAGTLRRQVAQRPVLAAVAALAIGVVAAVLIPGPKVRT